MPKDENEDIHPVDPEDAGSGHANRGKRGYSPGYKVPKLAVIISILAFVAWSVFILVYALYSSSHFSWFQNIIVTIVSLLITGLVIGLMWVILGPNDMWKQK